MCGIVGCVGTQEAQPFLLGGLAQLEYRGYDSAGMAVVGPEGTLRVLKRKGRVAELAAAAEGGALAGTCGIAHTRWATHGAPSERNAHPFVDCAGALSLVHNGIIENFSALRAELEAAGHTFTSDTDSEAAVHLVEELYEGDLLTAVRAACARLEGAYALVVCSAARPDELVCARKGSPLVVAATPEGCYAASDLTALLPKTRDVVVLEDGQTARLRADGTMSIYDALGGRVQPQTLHVDWDVSSATLGGYPDFMAKEIAEQPEVARRLLHGRCGGEDPLPELPEAAAARAGRVFVVACGTSYHAGLFAKGLVESWARVPVEVDVASEFNYREALVEPGDLFVSITQSGETADTLAASRKARAAGAYVLAVTNVIGSTAAREADAVLYLQAGPEVSVASTKAYTAQLAAMALFALKMARSRGGSPDLVAARTAELASLPGLLSEVLARAGSAAEAAHVFEGARSALFLGRGLNSATASEGALKLKEISYLHAESYAAGEMKHGPIALLEPGFPVVVVAPADRLRAKTVSNIAEIRARGAGVVAVATEGDDEVASLAEEVLWLPAGPTWLTPATSAVYLQLLAREVALDRGCDIDKPRNLAKSVTTE
jgi:glucosamine--fructose-6-phosphate aminotransferase (isomerizing)